MSKNGKLTVDEISKRRIESNSKTSTPGGGHDDKARGKGPVTPKPSQTTFGPPPSGGRRTN